MANLALALSFRDSIQDPAVIEELDRAYARLNGALRGIGQTDGEAGLDGEGPGPGVQITSFAQLDGPVVFPVKEITLAADSNVLNIEDAEAIRLVPSATVNVHGIAAGTDGQLVTVYVNQDAAFAVTLKHDSSTANANRRMQLAGAADIVTVANEARAFSFKYDGAVNNWIQIGGSAILAQAGGGDAVDVNTTEVQVENTVTETSVYSVALDANALGSGKILHLKLFGTYRKTAAGGSNFAVKVDLGSTTIISGNIATSIGPLAATRRALRLDVFIVGLGSNQQAAIVWAQFTNNIASATWTTAITSSGYGWNDSLSEDSATSLTLDVLVTHSVAAVGTSFDRHSAVTLIY